MILFFDTSALIKRYLHEKGSARVRRLLQTGGAIFYQTFLTPVEMTSAFYRQHRDGQISIEELSLLLMPSIRAVNTFSFRTPNR